MLTSVFLKSIRDMRGQILGWGGGTAVLAGSIVLVFPSFQDNVQDVIEMLPGVVQRLIGDQTGTNALEGFLRLKLFDSWLPIFLSVFVILHGAAAIVGEEERRTMDLLMANPVRRGRVLLEKFAASAVALTLMCGLISVGLAAAVRITGADASIGRLVWATFNAVPIALVFGAVALVGSSVAGRTRHAATASVALLVGSYFLYTLAPLSQSIEPWVKLSLFYYYSKTEPFGDGIVMGYVTLLVGLSGVLLATAAAAFRRKDLAS